MEDAYPMKFRSVEALRFIEFDRTNKTDLDADADGFRNDDRMRNYYAFTSLAHSPADGRLYCGTTNSAQDLLYRLDPATGQFESLGYAELGERHEVKIHRGLDVGPEGTVYGATSCLSSIDELAEAPGGKVFRFDPGQGRYEVLGHPVPHLYIQTISVDHERGMIYGMAYPDFELFAFAIETGEVVYRRFMGSISHIGVIDPEGGYWGTWLKGRRHLLYRYEPDRNAVKFFPHGFPMPCRNLMYLGAGPIDSAIDGGDGYCYIGHESGELYRLDWRTGGLTYLAKPLPGTRMPGLAVGEDGLLFGVGGADRATAGFVYDRNTGRSEGLGPIAATDEDATCFRTHDCCLVGSDLYVGETDNRERSCYLWKCAIA
jgi:hypothetical protein